MRTLLRKTLAPLFAAVLVAVAGFALVPASTVLADEIDDAIAEMMAAAKDKDAGKCIAKMVELQDSLDKRVGAAFNKLVKNRDTKIAAAAIRQLGTRKDETFGKSVGKAIGNKKLYKSKDDKMRPVYVAYLDAAAMYGNPKHSKALADIVKKFMQTDPEYCTKAIKAYGSVQDKAIVDQLIKWLVQTESTGQSQGGKNMSQETRDNYGRAKSQLIETLEVLTAQPIGDGKSWQEFWDKKRKEFKFPDLNAAEVDPATLDEWSDPAYGYTVKKPEGEGWAFKKTEWDAIRMRLEKTETTEDGEYVLLRVDFQIHNLSSQTPKSIKELAAWYVEDYKNERFSDLRGSEPELVEKKVAGRDFYVITAKGESGGSYKGWGTAEMRAYLTKVGHIVVRMDCTARLGAEPEDREKLWKVIEESTWDVD
jgi:hypothetical protein